MVAGQLAQRRRGAGHGPQHLLPLPAGHRAGGSAEGRVLRAASWLLPAWADGLISGCFLELPAGFHFFATPILLGFKSTEGESKSRTLGTGLGGFKGKPKGTRIVLEGLLENDTLETLKGDERGVGVGLDFHKRMCVICH